MTFDPAIPKAAQSPGLFPTQNNTNYTRLKTIINADHVFNDTAASTDGVHRQMTLVSRTHPVSLPVGTNSMLYSFSGTTQQLWFYDGSTNFQLTPPQQLYPIRVVGSASVASGATTTAYADPGFRWAGTGHGIIDNTESYGYYTLLRSGSSNNTNLINQNNTSIRPTLLFAGNNLQIRNNDVATRTLVWSLIINRIS